MSKILKAIKPLNAKDPNRTDGALLSNTVHKRLYVETLQNEWKNEPAVYSKLNLTINEDYRGILWIGVEVDGKRHVIETFASELYEEIKRLVEGPQDNS